MDKELKEALKQAINSIKRTAEYTKYEILDALRDILTLEEKLEKIKNLLK